MVRVPGEWVSPLSGPQCPIEAVDGSFVYALGVVDGAAAGSEAASGVEHPASTITALKVSGRRMTGAGPERGTRT